MPCVTNNISHLSCCFPAAERPGWPVVEVAGEDLVQEGGTQLTVTCTSQGGNPPPALTWVDFSLYEINAEINVEVPSNLLSILYIQM